MLTNQFCYLDKSPIYQKKKTVDMRSMSHKEMFLDFNFLTSENPKMKIRINYALVTN